MAETRESLMAKIKAKEEELHELEVRCLGYWDSAQASGSALAEAQRLGNRINSRRATIRRMYERLESMQINEDTEENSMHKMSSF